VLDQERVATGRKPGDLESSILGGFDAEGAGISVWLEAQTHTAQSYAFGGMHRSPQGGVFKASKMHREGQEAKEEKGKHTGGELGGARVQDRSPFVVEFPLYMTVLARGVKL